VIVSQNKYRGDIGTGRPQVAKLKTDQAGSLSSAGLIICSLATVTGGEPLTEVSL